MIRTTRENNGDLYNVSMGTLNGSMTVYYDAPEEEIDITVFGDRSVLDVKDLELEDIIELRDDLTQFIDEVQAQEFAEEPDEAIKITIFGDGLGLFNSIYDPYDEDYEDDYDDFDDFWDEFSSHCYY